MENGKTIYSGNVLGNGKGDKKGFTHVQGKQTKEKNTKQCEKWNFKACKVIFKQISN